MQIKNLFIEAIAKLYNQDYAYLHYIISSTFLTYNRFDWMVSYYFCNKKIIYSYYFIFLFFSDIIVIYVYIFSMLIVFKVV